MKENEIKSLEKVDKYFELISLEPSKSEQEFWQNLLQNHGDLGNNIKNIMSGETKGGTMIKFIC